MCVTNNLQRHIRNLTGDGEVVARFLVDTVEGKHSDAKYHHKLEAVKYLVRYGNTGDDHSHDEQSQFWGLIPTPEELATAKREEREQSPHSPHSTRHSCESRNPAGQCQGAGYDDRETSSPSFTPMSTIADDETTFIDDLDCYYEPLTPEDQAIFNYNSLMESGEFEEGEITFVPPSEAAHRDYAIALKQIREAAASEGIPLLPNPLAGTLHHPNIRSP